MGKGQPEDQKIKKPKVLREEIRDVLKGLGTPEPHIQLAYYSAGVDPCGGPSHFFDLMKKCQDRRVDGTPQPEDWEQLWEYFIEHPEFHMGFVDSDIRFAAANNLMPFLHPKLKSVEVSGELSHLIRVEPLTNEDIARLRGRLRNEF